MGNSLIKFRAWDKNHEYMEYTDENLIVSFGDNGNVDVTDLSNIYSTCEGMQNFELMQSTGLKDKDGTEIYEGDIIRGSYDTGIIGYETVTTEVKYDLLKGFQLGQFDLNITEVIGNIYENPEKCGFVEREF